MSNERLDALATDVKDAIPVTEVMRSNIDCAIQKLEYLMEGDPRSFSNQDCEYDWVFHGISEVLKILKEIERKTH